MESSRFKDFFFLLSLSLTAILLLVGVSQAQSPVFETATGSASVVNMVLSSASVTQMDAAPRRMAATPARRMSFELWNDDATNNAFCGFSLNISSVAPTISVANSFYGRRIPPRSSWTVSASYQIPVYCTTDTGNTVVVLTQLGGW